jgi:hypothetical protein
MRDSIHRSFLAASASLAVTASLFAPLQLAAQSFTPIRVNAGGGAYTDGAGNVWSADTGYNSGQVTSTMGNAIAGTTDDTLFQTARSAAAAGFDYSFTVPNGFYEVRLLFAEGWICTYWVGARIFDVELEGSVALSNIDVYAEAGGCTALARTSVTAVTDGVLNVRFVRRVDNPFVSAIEITATTKPTAPKNLVVSPAVRTT